MKNYIKYLSFCFLIIVALPVWTQISTTPMKDVPGFKQKLTTVTAGINTIESDFTQEKKLSILSNTLVSKGHFCFRRENNIRWEYLLPYKYLIIISQDKIYIKEEKDQKQYDIQSNKMFQEMNWFISGCIQGDILKNDKDYKIGYYEDSRYFFVTLVPVAEKMRQILNEIQIWFDRTDLTVARIRMMESGGDYTKIDFVNKKLNTVIPVEKFSFK
jgi:outer membrane lipoprotein-sorting protein